MSALYRGVGDANAEESTEETRKLQRSGDKCRKEIGQFSDITGSNLKFTLRAERSLSSGSSQYSDQESCMDSITFFR